MLLVLWCILVNQFIYNVEMQQAVVYVGVDILVEIVFGEGRFPDRVDIQWGIDDACPCRMYKAVDIEDEVLIGF